MLEELNDESFQNIDLKLHENDFNDYEENENYYKKEINNNKKDVVGILPTIAETFKGISNNISEVRKEELKTEQNKDNNTIDIANKLLEKNADTEKVMNFVKSERDKDRTLQIIKTGCDTAITISIIALGGYFISKLFKNKNNSNN